MIKARAIRIAVTLGAVAATLASSMLPAEHLHTSPAGPPIVHRHIVDDAAEHGGDSAIDHADHRGVKTLEATFVSERQDDVIRPLITVEPVLIAPNRSSVGRVESIETVMAHGPPTRVDSLRAPPA